MGLRVDADGAARGGTFCWIDVITVPSAAVTAMVIVVASLS